MRKRRLELLVWAFVLSLAYYQGPFGFVAWFALIRPLMIITPLRGRQAFTAAYFFGFSFTALSIYWIAIVTPPGTFGAIMLVGFYYAVVLWTINLLYWFRPILGIILAPVLWVGMEHFRTLTEFAFPWSDLGYTQSYYLWIIQIVSIVSVHGLSLIIMTVNVLLWQVLRKEVDPANRVTCLLLPLGFIALLSAYGWAVIPKYPTEGDISVTVLQGSIPIEEKWAADNAGYTFEKYGQLIDQVTDSTVDLYVWPETVLPCYLARDKSCLTEMAELAKRSGTYHLVGTLSARRIDGELRHFNSCFQVDPEGRIGQLQEKVKLVPFSEQVPYQKYLWFLRPKVIREFLTFIETYDVQWWSDFHPGDSSVIFQTPKTSYGVLICFESTFPEYAREVILKGARFLVGITNDTWFGQSVGVHMHARIFLTRAIENRCWGVRVANSGLSYVVDDYGRIRSELALYESAALTARVGELSEFSVFTKVGDLAGKFSFLILCATLTILGLTWLTKKLFG